MRMIAPLAAIASLAVLLTGCPKPKPPAPAPVEEVKDYTRPLPPGQLGLRKLTDPNDIPNFTSACINMGLMKESIDYSLDFLGKPSSKAYFPYGQITHEQAVASLKAFSALADQHLSPADMNAKIREQFDVYISVGWDMRGTVLFTGYYTPIFDASMTKTDKFRYPLYKAPADLVKGPDGAILGRRGADGQITAYPERKEIESSNMLAGLELVYVSDPFEVYIAHVQGSAKLRLPDGNMITVGYTANNGHEYKSIAKEMVSDGKIPKEKLSLHAMIDYFKLHPDEAGEYIGRNPRFVFFAQSEGGPRGCLNEPVTPRRSIATDKSIFPRACLAFIATKLPWPMKDGIEEMNYTGFALDQDAGGAIRAPGRCDVYMGVGEQAGELAGRTQQEGRLFYLFLKPAAMTPPALPAMGPGDANLPPAQP